MSSQQWPRGTSNSAERGSAASRRERKQWLLSPQAGFGGDGSVVPCFRVRVCGQEALTYFTMQVDRIRPGILGGRYVRHNIRPACRPCNFELGIALREQIRRGEILIMPLDSQKGTVALWRDGRGWTAAALQGGRVIAETTHTNRVTVLANLSVSLLEEVILRSNSSPVEEKTS